jgi:hypothetical protein
VFSLRYELKSYYLDDLRLQRVIEQVLMNVQVLIPDSFSLHFADTPPSCWQVSPRDRSISCPHTGRARQVVWRQSQSALNRHPFASSCLYLLNENPSSAAYWLLYQLDRLLGVYKTHTKNTNMKSFNSYPLRNHTGELTLTYQHFS